MVRSTWAAEGTQLDPAAGPLSGAARPSWPIQPLKFLAVGVLNTLIDAGMYLALTHHLGLAALPALAKALSYSIGVLNSYVWNRSWTFGSQANIRATLLPFAVSSLVALAINTGVMHLCLEVLHALPANEIISLALATATTLVWNFAASKFVIFRR